MIILFNILSWSWSSSSPTSSSCVQFLEARVASNEEGNLYVDITELRMDQVLMHGPYHINGKFGSKCSLFSFHSHLPDSKDSFIFILDPQTYITYYHNWLRMALIGILPFSAICCLNLRIFLAVRSNLKYVDGKTSPEQHHLGGDACLEIMISGATTTTSPRSRGETHSGAHRHRHHLPDMQPAQVQCGRVEPLIPTKISSLSSTSLSG